MRAWIKLHTKALIIGTALFCGVLLLIISALMLREPEICSLCGSGEERPYHAPVLVDLSTGESIELRVYDMEITNQMEIAQEQTTGTFCPLRLNGHSGYRDTCDQTCRRKSCEQPDPINASCYHTADCSACQPDHSIKQE